MSQLKQGNLHTRQYEFLTKEGVFHLMQFLPCFVQSRPCNQFINTQQLGGTLTTPKPEFVIKEKQRSLRLKASNNIICSPEDRECNITLMVDTNFVMNEWHIPSRPAGSTFFHGQGKFCTH